MFLVEEAAKALVGDLDSLCDLPVEGPPGGGGQGDPPVLNLNFSSMSLPGVSPESRVTARALVSF